MKTILALCICALAVISQAGCDTAMTRQIKDARVILGSIGVEKTRADSMGDRIAANPKRFFELLEKALLGAGKDGYLLRRVDKARNLPQDYIPADLIDLDGMGLTVSRPGHRLRKEAFDALRKMDLAARSKGVILQISSSYRSFEYQKTTFGRAVAEMGETEAARVSARPGMSQHQLGTALDFGSISDDFALTAASAWLVSNAGKYGFSLSYPRDMESATGYQWESWHYRYIGIEAAALQSEYFDNVQHYLLRFIEEYQARHTKR